MKISIIRGLADNGNPNSFANKLRDKRFRGFESLVARLPRPVRVLDVGGTNEFWERRGWVGRADIQIVALNRVAQVQRHGNVQPVAGDATDLSSFDTASFDVVFSNSVIEHLFTFEKQMKMAAEVRRVGKAYWVQTPNYWFPMEPHFHVLGWHWMPLGFRVALLQRWRCGWNGPCPDQAEAQKAVEEVRLLRKSELRVLFPGANLVPERFCGTVKSWTAVDGFGQTRLLRGSGR